MNPLMLTAWLRSRLRTDERGLIARDTIVVVLVVVAIIALVLWILTTFAVTKK